MSEEQKTIEIPVVPVEGEVTPVEYMTRFHEVLRALGIPAERDGTKISYGEMSDEEGAMVEPLMHLIDARFANVRHDGEASSSR